MTIVGDLQFDKTFTLRLFALGGTLRPTDILPIFLYSQGLYVDGLPWNGTTNPLQYTIEMGYLPDWGYVWDLSGASLLVNPLNLPQGIYLTGAEVFAVPEPGTLALLGLGALALSRRRRRAA